MTVTLQQAQAQLPQLLKHMVPGEELFIEQDNHRVARLIAEVAPPSIARVAGQGQGQVVFMADDFNAPVVERSDLTWKTNDEESIG